MSHSWTGNLITNHTWEHFWLNEGWTVWLERKIKGHMKGAAHYDFSAISGAKHLADDVALYGAANPLTHMVPQLRDVDPDDAFSSVPYEKGFNLLHYLSTVVGGAEVFEGFARAYVQHFKFKTLTSADFRAFFMEWCRAHRACTARARHAHARIHRHTIPTSRSGEWVCVCMGVRMHGRCRSREIDASAVDWEAWLLAPGMPPILNTFSNELGAACSALADRWLAAAAPEEPKKTIAGARATDVEGWSSAQLIALLEHMLSSVGDAAAVPPPPLASRLDALDALYKLSASRNAEVCMHALPVRAPQYAPHMGCTRAAHALHMRCTCMPGALPLAEALHQDACRLHRTAGLVDPAARCSPVQPGCSAVHPTCNSMDPGDRLPPEPGPHEVHAASLPRAFRVARAEARRGRDLHCVGGKLSPDLPPDGLEGPRPHKIAH